MMAMLHSGMLRCSGNAMLPSLMNISMCVFDVIFNYFFIYILNLGVAGAALGTGMAQMVVGFILMYIVVKKEKSLRLLGDESWKINKEILKNVVNLSIPAGLERVTLSLAQVVMTGVVSSMGAISVAINYVAVSAEGLEAWHSLSILTCLNVT
jgi:Na+-driven multidrug efflux pump